MYHNTMQLLIGQNIITVKYKVLPNTCKNLFKNMKKLERQSLFEASLKKLKTQKFQCANFYTCRVVWVV